MHIKPFLRWAGGKRWLARELSSLLSKRLGDNGTYFEPFLGSGAMYFAIDPGKAVLSDLNDDLINTFKQVARCPHAIVDRLEKMPTLKREYRRVRNSRPTLKIDRAVRFIYLNRNCYGGLYRENQKGVFNVPYGGGDRTHDIVCREGIIPNASSLLRRSTVELNVCDFEESFKRAQSGDVVYCDPTYREVTRKQFDRYGKIIFRWEDQERLAQLASEAFRRGVLVIVSNTRCNGIRDLYSDAGVIAIKRRQGLGPISHRERHEHIFVLDPLQDWSFWGNIGLIRKPKQQYLRNRMPLAYTKADGMMVDCL